MAPQHVLAETKGQAANWITELIKNPPTMLKDTLGKLLSLCQNEPPSKPRVKKAPEGIF